MRSAKEHGTRVSVFRAFFVTVFGSFINLMEYASGLSAVFIKIITKVLRNVKIY